MSATHLRRRLLPLVASALLAPAFAWAADPSIGLSRDADTVPAVDPRTPARLVVYGPSAQTREGDYDLELTIYVALPADLERPVYLRVFDADTGAEQDAPYGPFDTVTRFSLFGQGIGIDAGQKPKPESETGPAGDGDSPPARNAAPLVEQQFGAAPALNNKWHTLGQLDPEQGQPVGAERLFKLVVSGVRGNDGNLFDVAVSADPRRNVPVPGARLFSFSPTLRVDRPDRVAEARFRVPDGDWLSVANFDAAYGLVALEFPLRTVPLTASGQDEWRRDRVAIEPAERAQTAAVVFGGGNEMPNDATLAVFDADGDGVPLELPIYLWQRNRRPRVSVETAFSSDCRSVAFDAGGTTDADADLLDYRWRFGDGGRGRGAAVVHRYDRPGRYPVQLTVSDRSGQVGNGSRVEVPLRLNRPPRAVIASPAVLAPLEKGKFDGAGSTDADGRILAYAWQFGDGKRARGKSAVHRYRRPGRYRLTLGVRDDGGEPCGRDRAVAEVWVNAAPLAVAAAPRVVAVGQQVDFDASDSFDRDGSLVAYDWTFGDGARASGEKAVHRYDKPGRYTVGLTVADDAAASNSRASDSLTLSVNAPPMAVAGPDRRAAVAEPIAFDGRRSTDPDGSLIDYRWDFGDGRAATGAQVRHAYASPGSYAVTLTVYDDSGLPSGSASDSLRVEVNQPPVADAGPDQRVNRSDVAFSSTGSGDPDGRIASYRWSFGDGAASDQADPVHSYARPGVYRVRLTVTDDSGTPRSSASDEAYLLVNRAPVADAGGERTGAPGQRLQFSARGSFDQDGEITGYDWDFGDGSSAQGMEVSHRYVEPGAYTVRLTVTDDSGAPSAARSSETRALINAPPVADAGPDHRVAPGQVLVLDGSGSFDPDGRITGSHWEVDPGGIRHQGVRLKTAFDRPGVYTARLTVQDDGRASNSVAVDEALIRVNHRPQAIPGGDRVTADSTVLLDGSASLDADGDSLSYRWDLGDGSPPRDGARLAYTYAEGGSYPVTLTVDDGTGLANATDSAAIKLDINRAPIARAGGQRTVCAGDPVLFDAGASSDPEGGRLKYHWDLGDGTTADGVNPTKVYAGGGRYTVTLNVYDDSGLPDNRATDRAAVTVIDSPIADAGPDREVCANTDVRFDGSGSRDRDGVVNRYRWEFGDGRVGGGERPVHVYSRPGTYKLRLLIEGDPIAQCDYRHSDEATVTVVGAPRASIEAPKVVAVDQAVRFDASGSDGAGGDILSYGWDFGDGRGAVGAQVAHRYEQAGEYLVSLDLHTAGSVEACSRVTTRRRIVVNSAPRALFDAPRVAGVNQELRFDASGSSDDDGVLVSYVWDFGDGTRGEGVETRHRFAAPGVYPVKLTVSDDSGASNGRSESEVEVTVNGAPQPVIDAPAAACVGELVAFSGAASHDPDGRIGEYRWDFGDGQTAVGVDSVHVYAAPGQYGVTLEVSDEIGVTNSDSRSVKGLSINQTPIADAGPDHKACAGQRVVFDGGASVDPDGQLTDYSWDFGDGHRARGRKVEHRYDRPGRYQVRLTVDDDSGSTCASAVDSASVTINAAPVAVAGEDREALFGGAHDEVLFDATGSRDPDGDPLSYRWDFGDGDSGSGAILAHPYRKAGRYRVTLKVRDDSGTDCDQGTGTLTVSVRGRPAK